MDTSNIGNYTRNAVAARKRAEHEALMKRQQEEKRKKQELNKHNLRQKTQEKMTKLIEQRNQLLEKKKNLEVQINSLEEKIQKQRYFLGSEK